jgi:carbon storage regulator CsrA
MLVLTRKLGEKILIGDNVVLTVVEIRSGTIRLGIDAPQDVSIRRAELSAPPALRPGMVARNTTKAPTENRSR